MFVRKDKSALRAYMLCSTASVATYVSHLWQVGIVLLFSLCQFVKTIFIPHKNAASQRKKERTNERTIDLNI